MAVMSDEQNSHPMDPERLRDLRRTIHPVTHPDFSALLADRDYHARRTDAAEAEAKRWRARCPVTSDDIRHAGITWPHVQAWSEANDSPLGQSHGMDTPHWAEGDGDSDLMESLILTTIRVAMLRSPKWAGSQLCEHDILDQIAAMEPK